MPGMLIIGLIVAVCAAVLFHWRCEIESSPEGSFKHAGQTTALVEPFLLPIYLIVMFLCALLLPRSERIQTFYLGNFVILLLCISIYYAALLCVLPLVRRYISARTCAALWLLPNLLYLIVLFPAFGSSPLFVITLPRQWLRPFGLIWASGFLLVLLWQILSHFRYRRFLLRDAVPVADPNILRLWELEQKYRERKRPIPILVSEKTNTPLSIGCFSRTLRLVLPHLNYTPEELKLIFRHELRHIQRSDTRTKAFLGFCTALCWFNPLVWIARRKVSDDLELSCDELVLIRADDATRRQYARLLLDTAGSGKGYTTCLSAAASSLRYRLKHIVTPRKRLSGSILVGLALFMLILCQGAFALADSPDTIQALVFDQALAGSAMDSVFIKNWGEVSENRSIYGWDKDALHEYLGSLSVREVYTTDAYTYLANGRRALIIDYRSETGSRWSPFFLCDGLLFVEFPFEGQGRQIFLLTDEIDWDYIASLLDFDAEPPGG